MAQDNKREQLVSFLDQNAFDPVLEANSDDYSSESQKKRLRNLQEATRREKKRYHEDYESAQKVRDNFKDDLSSDEAQEVQRGLKDLNLPTLQDVEEEFDQLCNRVGVER